MIAIYILLPLVVLLGTVALLARYHKGFKKAIGKYFYNWLFGLPWGVTNTTNYGFAPTVPAVESLAGEEKYQVQLYCELAATIDPSEWEGLKVLEVGCGRGGGLRHLTTLMRPEEATGLDFSANAIRYCKRHSNGNGQRVKFVRGDAHALPFPDASFDVVLNVESSHIYEDQAKFFREVFRVLRPGGRFLMADYRERGNGDMARLHAETRAAGLALIQEQDITQNVLQACIDDTQRRELLIRQAPGFIRSYLREFAMVDKSAEIRKFEDAYHYFIHQLEKH